MTTTRDPVTAPGAGSPLPNLLTVPEAAARCRSSIRTVRRWIADGRIPVHRLGRKVLIADHDLAVFLDSCRRTATASD